jgi:conjugal transfer pilus assembly protein TrbC
MRSLVLLNLLWLMNTTLLAGDLNRLKPPVLQEKDHAWLTHQLEKTNDLDQLMTPENQEWLKDHLKTTKQELSKQMKQQVVSMSSSSQCTSCSANNEETIPAFYVFMSFSLKDTTWLEWSKQIETLGGAFILRGLPNQSFKELASHLNHLNDIGVRATIQLNPQLFDQYQIQQVPAVVVAEEETFDKITGNVTLDYALETLAKEGETKKAQALYEKLKEARKL